MTPGSTGTTRYLLDGLSVIAQYAPSGSRQALYVQSLTRIDEVLSVTNSTGKYWYQTDALGSVYTLTTSTGAVQARGGYDVFGEPVALSGTAVGQPFGFTGREHEADSGLVYSRERFLDPGTGRFSRVDPLHFLAGPNFYAYASFAVTAAPDPMGLYAKSTVEGYAISHWVPFLHLVVDLGVIAAGVLVAADKMFGGPSIRCDEDDDDDGIRYYRGLSVGDERELAGPTGVISSKMRRSGADIEQGLLAHFSGAAKAHTYTSKGSPYVSATLEVSVARRFARGLPRAPKDPDDAPSGWVVTFVATRPPVAPGLPGDMEFLFFWMLGPPREVIVPVEWVKPAWP